MKKDAIWGYLAKRKVHVEFVTDTYIQTDNMNAECAVNVTKSLMDFGVLSSEIECLSAYYGVFLRIKFDEEEDPEEFTANPAEVKDVLIDIFHDKIINEMSECDGALRDVTSEDAQAEYDVRTFIAGDDNKRLGFEVDGYLYSVSVEVTKVE